MNLFYQPLLPEGILYLDADESRHCIKVLRHNTGDVIHITDGKGFFYDAVITKADDRQCTFRIQEKSAKPVRDYTIHIAISPTKNADRIEWFVEKAVELGVDIVSIINCENTERTYLKKERLEKVAVSAMKQSLKATLPRIEGLLEFDAIVKSEASQKFIAFVDQQNPDHLKNIALPGKDYLVLIGPEGDFSAEELSAAIANGFQKVSLGQSRLRTETAGLAACHILNLAND
ncbi:16S rRNA (uracil(1498)-N(3))-methyltransferase [Ohtaekwangia koreensis]|uniref:Ribosomal RNA small subunit methyltransferase E n=1 Tax=Ohtaekwangia koreensis TaxID=688867 RepID=A0A1T5M4W9_9BACT|nr:16S rRNA (uracil(1498)-N(3))-methyltransferase [Ohtaekwangia koreensis]SKC83094.1 16S rRNA (uracil1498-N3)-methyltransferase [Ohtaekwangia koreensis]